MLRYCYSFGPNGLSMRAVAPDYQPAEGEQISENDIATAEQIEAWFPGAADAKARCEARAECDRLIEAAYGGSAKRLGLIGYGRRIDAKIAAKKATDEEKADSAVLIAADEWEDEMLAAAAAATATQPPVWIDPPAGLAEIVAAS